jgi:alkylation response protein AidB-like acyl-CoA dehydrogenase
MILIEDAGQTEFRAVLRTFLAEHSTSEQVRAAMASDLGYDVELWRRLAADLGVLGLVVPEKYGGAGAGHVERAILAGELGRALAPVPFLSSAVMAVDVLQSLGDASACAELLPDLASGQRIAAVAIAEPDHDGAFDLSPGVVKADAHGDEWRIHGTKSPVIGGDMADVLLVLAQAPDGPAFFLIDTAAPEVTRTPLRTLDPTRPLTHFDLTGVAARRLAGDAATAERQARDLFTVALAAEQAAAMGRALELTVDYARERMQFGRPIGSYQAVKHGCADMYCAWEQALSAVRFAAWAADHAPDDLPVAAALARVFVPPACFAAARSMVHYHGGMGYTWEHDAQLFYKRAKAVELLLGSPGRQRLQLADALAI